ncbi:MAG: nickel pincer cofactor biosynthesis protein LarC [Tannerella sp.]|nr:nickel pincer cofactor biosynthesis protein LarC [Tannerella sp.]
MKILYFDCFAGISGDMTLSALMDLGIDKEQLTTELSKLGLKGWTLETSETSKNGIGAKQTHVIVSGEEQTHHAHKWHNPFHHHTHSHPHRTMADIAQIIDDSGINPNAKDLAKRIFMRLAAAEAKVHGSTPEEVHFHEVGAVDSIIDIVGTAICIDILQPDKIFASILHDGHGFVNCQHGKIPVPVPAVIEVLTERHVTIKQLDIDGEMTTPTGAAIVAELAESFGEMPEMKILKTGYGAGKKNFIVPNLLRVFWGEATEIPPSTNNTHTHSVTVIETNIDDTTPEVLGYVMERLFEAGARDVFFTPIYMKKCRPATRINILCDDADAIAMEEILFTETSTIGVRRFKAERTCLPRKAVTIATPYGEVLAKESIYNNTHRISIEYEDAHRLAREKGVPLREILQLGYSFVYQ